LLKHAYKVIDSHSYLDWGLTSDYDGGAMAQGRSSARGPGPGVPAPRGPGPGRPPAKEPGPGPPSGRGSGSAGGGRGDGRGAGPRAERAERGAGPRSGPSGLGGNTRGSEGYGELTTGKFNLVFMCF